MKINRILTKDPLNGNANRPRGSKLVFDAENKLIGSYKKGKLFDLNGMLVSDCPWARKRDLSAEEGVYRHNGGFVYSGGIKFGRIEEDIRFAIVLLLFLIFAAASVIFVMINSRAVKPIPVFTVEDKDGYWTASGDIDIFGSQKLRPGAKGEYFFSVNNPNDFDLDMDIEIRFVYDGKELRIPLRYLLSSDGKIIDMKDRDDGYDVYGLLLEKETLRTYNLSWEWLFDGKKDFEDTLIGITGGKYTCTITIKATMRTV